MGGGVKRVKDFMKGKVYIELFYLINVVKLHHVM